MKSIKTYIIIMLLISFLGIIVQPVYANQTKLPATLEVGLFFNNSAKSTLNLKAANGFIVRQHRNTDRIQLMNLVSHDDIIVRKDGFYLGSGGNYVEYTGPIQERVGQQVLQGPFHVQVGKLFPSITEAEKFIASLKIQENPYLVYEGGWKVFVGLYIDEKSSKKSADEIKTNTGEEAIVIQPSSTRVQVLDKQDKVLFMYDATEQIYFQAFQDKGSIPLVNVEGKNYRGEITVKRMNGNDMAVINKVPLEEYLYGVIPREMPALWPLEALKAQAVAARGYAVTSMGRFKNSGFDLCNTTNSQVYGGYDGEHVNSNRAVDETKSRIITYNGNPVIPYFHANSGGHTENSENIWSNALPYIRGVKDDYSLGVPSSTWNVTFTGAQIKEALEKNGIFIGEPKSITITERSVNGRVLTLIVEGTKGKETMTKEKSRRVFGLRSTWFNVSLQGGGSVAVKTASKDGSQVNVTNAHVMTADGLKVLKNSTNIKMFNGKSYKEIESGPEVFSFEGKGFGHGLGLSQHGARKMAELNFTFDQILTHYYTGVKVELR